MEKSTIKASKAAGMAPKRTRLLFARARPRLMNCPSPPAPINADRVAIPTPVTAAVLIPATMTGRASGILIL